ncbi:uncharacterized protein LOC114756776 [Neltuma alba]|uniref:uncharacterized protein LOC114756776 n=1 Tax=Neltuma alba TaxID=207710 RepID=UPI0010A36C3F|nr:uncharacterized protein LOC114756776 [Prosopis alba]
MSEQWYVMRRIGWLKRYTQNGVNTPGDLGEEEPQKKSYRQACSSKDNGPSCDEEDEEAWWFDEGWRNKVRVEQTTKGPNVIIMLEFKEKLARKWRLSLIVRLLGRMVREEYLGQKLQKLWGYNRDVETLEIGSGYFIVNFTHTNDYEYALTGGPWLVLGHYLNVQPWKPDFDPDEEEVSKVAAWICIPKFPMDYYDMGILYVVGSQIGTILRVDKNTLSHSKG